MIKEQKVSIIIPTWNRKEDLKKCLMSIKNLNYTNLEIIITNNGSTDGTIEMLKSMKSEMTIIQNRKNLGASYAKNQGATKSRCEFLWFLDSDSEIINANCLNEMIKILNGHPSVAMVGGEVVEEQGEKKYKLSKAARYGIGTIGLKNEKDYMFLESNFITTANCLVRRNIFFEVGGFNPEYFYGGEDTDLSRKITQRGYKGIVDRKIAVLHRLSIKQRRSNFFLQEKNRVRRHFFHEPIWLFPVLPFLDILSLIKTTPHFLNQIKKRDIKESALFKKSFSKNKTKSSSKQVNLIQLFILYFFSFIYGYFFNIIMLPRSLYIRFVYKNRFLNINKDSLETLEIKKC